MAFRMRIPQQIFLFALIIGTLSRCTDAAEKDGKIYLEHLKPLHVDTIKTALPLSTFVDSISYTRLNPSPVPIAKADKVEIFNDHIFVLDGNLSKALFAFDTSGIFRYIITIDNNKIPISDFCIDKQKNRLYVYVTATHRITEYDISNGNKLRDITIDGYFYKMNLLAGSKFLLLRDGVSKFSKDPRKYHQNRVCVFDSTGKYERGYFNKPLFPHINYGSIYGTVSDYDHTIRINRLYSDTVYAMSDTAMEARYNIRMPGYQHSATFFQSERVSEADAYMSSDSLRTMWSSFYETASYTAFYYTFNKSVFLYWQEKKTGKQYAIPYFINDIDEVPDMGSIKYMDEEKALSVTPAMSLLNVYKSYQRAAEKAPQVHNEKLIALCRDLTVSSNPVISIMYLKK